MSHYRLRHYASKQDTIDSMKSTGSSFEWSSHEDTFDKLRNAKEYKPVRYKDKSSELPPADQEESYRDHLFSPVTSHDSGEAKKTKYATFSRQRSQRAYRRRNAANIQPSVATDSSSAAGSRSSVAESERLSGTIARVAVVSPRKSFGFTPKVSRSPDQPSFRSPLSPLTTEINRSGDGKQIASPAPVLSPHAAPNPSPYTGDIGSARTGFSPLVPSSTPFVTRRGAPLFAAELSPVCPISPIGDEATSPSVAEAAISPSRDAPCVAISTNGSSGDAAVNGVISAFDSGGSVAVNGSVSTDISGEGAEVNGAGSSCDSGAGAAVNGAVTTNSSSKDTHLNGAGSVCDTCEESAFHGSASPGEKLTDAGPLAEHAATPKRRVRVSFSSVIAVSEGDTNPPSLTKGDRESESIEKFQDSGRLAEYSSPDTNCTTNSASMVGLNLKSTNNDTEVSLITRNTRRSTRTSAKDRASSHYNTAISRDLAGTSVPGDSRLSSDDTKSSKKSQSTCVLDPNSQSTENRLSIFKEEEDVRVDSFPGGVDCDQVLSRRSLSLSRSCLVCMSVLSQSCLEALLGRSLSGVNDCSDHPNVSTDLERGDQLLQQSCEHSVNRGSGSGPGARDSTVLSSSIVSFDPTLKETSDRIKGSDQLRCIESSALNNSSDRLSRQQFKVPALFHSPVKFKEPLEPQNMGDVQLRATRCGKGWRRSLVLEPASFSRAKTRRLSVLETSNRWDRRGSTIGRVERRSISTRRHSVMPGIAEISRDSSRLVGSDQSVGASMRMSRAMRRSSVYVAPVNSVVATSSSESSLLAHQEMAPLNSLSDDQARAAVLSLCSEADITPFAAYLRRKKIGSKIGEGVYGEVFLCGEGRPDMSVVKIIPIEGSLVVNDAVQKKFGEVLSELIISRRLSELRIPASNAPCDQFCVSEGFVKLIEAQVVRGSYPYRLMQAWHKYDKLKGSENESPECFDSDQLFLVLEYDHAGADLEAFTFLTPAHALSAFLQVACSLAVAESRLQFEHRDLHWGNVLVRQASGSGSPSDRSPLLFCQLDDVTMNVPDLGVKATLIDFTLSRMTVDQRVVFNNLSEDEELFNSYGDFQFEIYRMMRHTVEDQWWLHCPRTNVHWLDYLWHKICTCVSYEQPESRTCRRQLRRLQQLRPLIQRCDSARHLVVEHGTTLAMEITALLDI